MGALEEGLKKAMMSDARGLLEWLVNEAAKRQTVSGSRGTRTRRIETVLGPIHIRRAYCLQNGRRCFPFDRQLGLLDSYSPGLLRLMIHAGAMEASYEQAQQALQIYAGLSVVAKQIQRMMRRIGPGMDAWVQRNTARPAGRVGTMYVCCDGTGVPVRPEETAGRKGKSEDGIAKTREVKLGCVFNQLTTDEDGHPIREPSSTTYIASFDPSTSFGLLLRDEARRRGLGRAQRTVFIGDGAAWIWNLARINFPDAVQVLDYFHACEHITDLVRAVFTDISEAEQRAHQWRQALKQGRLAWILEQAQAYMPRSGPRRKMAWEQINYFLTNAERMRYAAFIQQGLFIGSGVVEAGCKRIIAQRMKQSGMHWTVPGAQAVASTRCCVLNDDYDEFWQEWDKQRAA